MDILIIYLEEQLLTKSYTIKHLILLNVYQRELAAMVYNMFDKKSSGSNISGGAIMKN